MSLNVLWQKDIYMCVCYIYICIIYYILYIYYIYVIYIYYLLCLAPCSTPRCAPFYGAPGAHLTSPTELSELLSNDFQTETRKGCYLPCNVQAGICFGAGAIYWESTALCIVGQKTQPFAPKFSDPDKVSAAISSLWTCGYRRLSKRFCKDCRDSHTSVMSTKIWVKLASNPWYLGVPWWTVKYPTSQNLISIDLRGRVLRRGAHMRRINAKVCPCGSPEMMPSRPSSLLERSANGGCGFSTSEDATMRLPECGLELAINKLSHLSRRCCNQK